MRITGVYDNGIKITGYKVTDGDKDTRVTVSKALEMVMGHMIENASAIKDVDDNKYIICIDDSLLELENAEEGKYRIVGKITETNENDKVVWGYVIEGDGGDKYKVSIDKAWRLAASCQIRGAIAKVVDGRKVIIGDFRKVTELSSSD